MLSFPVLGQLNNLKIYIKQRNKSHKNSIPIIFFSSLLPFPSLASVHCLAFFFFLPFFLSFFPSFFLSFFLFFCLCFCCCCCLGPAQGIQSCTKNRKHLCRAGVLLISPALGETGSSRPPRTKWKYVHVDLPSSLPRISPGTLPPKEPLSPSLFSGSPPPPHPR